jgi:hypothetical protein
MSLKRVTVRCAGSPLRQPHLLLVVVGADGWGVVVELVDLLGAQLDAIGGDVLLDPGDPLGARDRNDVVALCQQPGQGRHLRRRRTDLAGDAVDFVSDAQIALEVLR